MPAIPAADGKLLRADDPVPGDISTTPFHSSGDDAASGVCHGSHRLRRCHLSYARSRIVTAHTATSFPANPPPFSARPILAPELWYAPRFSTQLVGDLAEHPWGSVAPIGCPRDSSPPDGLTTTSPPISVAPDMVKGSSPRPQTDVLSIRCTSAKAEASCSSTTSMSASRYPPA